MKPAHKEGMKLRHCQPGRQPPYHQPAQMTFQAATLLHPFNLAALLPFQLILPSTPSLVFVYKPLLLLYQ